jgi:hypothetical protein
VEGYASRTIGAMQHLAVIDYRVWAGREDELEDYHRGSVAALGWGDEQKTFNWLSALRRIRDRRHSFGSLAPLTIFPVPAEDIADLMLGHLELFTTMRCDLLEDAFAARGIATTVAFPDGDKLFLHAERRHVAVDVPPHLREQMLFELMTPDTLIDMVDAVLDLIRRFPELQLASYTVGCDESAAWG